MDFGAWEGQRWNDIAKSDIDAWPAAFETNAPGGGERLSTMLARISAALRFAAQGAADNAGDRAGGEHGPNVAVNDVVWSTHAGVARCAHWLQQHGDTALPRADEWPQAAPGWGEWEVRTLA